MPIVPLHRNVSNGSAPKNTAQTSAITATVAATATAAAAGVALAPVRPRAWPGARSRTIANSSREAPTTQARQQAKALTQGAERDQVAHPGADVGRAEVAHQRRRGDERGDARVVRSRSAIISMAVTTVK